MRLTYDATTDVTYLSLRAVGQGESLGPTLLVKPDREFTEEATRTAAAILVPRERDRESVGGLGAKAFRLLDLLYDRPLVTVNSVATALDVSWPTAGKLIGRFETRGSCRRSPASGAIACSATGPTSHCSRTWRAPRPSGTRRPLRHPPGRPDAGALAARP